MLVTRDEDFVRFSTLRGAPPKVVLMTLHNPGNAAIKALLEAACTAIMNLVADDDLALLAIGDKR